ncbi:MAG: alpha/beta hydrolase [Myxococcales bacterium]|nr:alpha/beta hydrolase [Myxococcales bacterium]
MPSSFPERMRAWVGHRLARAPDLIVRHVTARRPVTVGGLRLEPRTQHALQLLKIARRAPLEALPVEVARREYADFPRVFDSTPRPLPRVEDDAIPGPAGEIPVRIYAASLEPRLPALVYFHGGGGVIGTIDTHDALCRLVTRALGGLLISVEYRLAPEHPFPAGLDDAVAAHRWASAHAEALGADPDRLAVGGDSMGGNLAAVVCQLARDSGGVLPRAQWLLYPAIDRTQDTESLRLFAEGFLLDAATIDWFTEQYAGDADLADPRVSPLRHPALGGLPPAVVVTAGFDPLRDEGQAYARALRAAGVEVRERCWDGLVHGFGQMTGTVEQASQAVMEAVGELRALLR